MLNLDTLTCNCGGDTALVVELAQVFLQEYPDYIAALDRATLAGGGEDVRVAAHRLRGVLSIFGAEAALDAATQLENLGASGQLAIANEPLVKLKSELLLVEGEMRALVAGGPRHRDPIA
jgi:two-component system, sensor histidine kinase and response regulator